MIGEYGIANYELKVTFTMDDGSQISMSVSGRTEQEFKDTLDRYRWIHFDGLSVNLSHVRHVTLEKVMKARGGGQ